MTILPKKKNSNKEARPNSNAEQHAHVEGSSLNSSSHISQDSNVNVRSGVDSTATLRRPLAHHFHEFAESDGALNGPHRKRMAGSSSNATVAPAARQDRSSPHRSIRKTRTLANAPKLSPAPGDAEEPPEYNSEDEYEQSAKGIEFSEELERKFEEKLKKSKSFIIKKMNEDGACLFRAVADQIYGDQEMHNVVRKLCMDYMAKNADHFSQFVTEDFDLYLARKRVDHVHGNHVEIQAMAEMFNRPIEVFQYSLEPINIFHNTSLKADITPIRVSYHRNMHYNSLVDPYTATVGVGLGFPQFHPGLAEKNLVRDAVLDSEQHEIEQTMLKDKLLATDWEATEEQLQEQIARESYLEWIRNEEKMMKENASGSRGESTITRPHKPRSPPNAQLSPSQPGATKSKSATSTPNVSDFAFYSSSEAGPSHRTPFVTENPLSNDLSPGLFGLSSGWDDKDIMSQVLALSQQEYLDSLKRQKESKSKSETAQSSKKSNDKSQSGEGSNEK